MAKIAHKAHEDLLTAGIHPDINERKDITRCILEGIKDYSKLDELAKELLGKPIEEGEVKIALKDSANRSVAGINGIPYKYWKCLHQFKKENNKSSKYKSLNIIKSPTIIYNDIEEFRVDPLSEFATGWMCSLYKKGNKRLIENYRPITLLYSDYKIDTKAQSIRLAKVAPKIIHPNQAGFMPGRNITNQVHLAKLMVNFSEAKEQDGMIIALDQEKVYNKNYLLQILKVYNLPIRFVKMVKLLKWNIVRCYSE